MARRDEFMQKWGIRNPVGPASELMFPMPTVTPGVNSAQSLLSGLGQGVGSGMNQIAAMRQAIAEKKSEIAKQKAEWAEAYKKEMAQQGYIPDPEKPGQFVATGKTQAEIGKNVGQVQKWQDETALGSAGLTAPTGGRLYTGTVPIEPGQYIPDAWTKPAPSVHYSYSSGGGGNAPQEPAWLNERYRGTKEFGDITDDIGTTRTIRKDTGNGTSISEKYTTDKKLTPQGEQVFSQIQSRWSELGDISRNPAFRFEAAAQAAEWDRLGRTMRRDFIVGNTLHGDKTTRKAAKEGNLQPWQKEVLDILESSAKRLRAWEQGVREAQVRGVQPSTEYYNPAQGGGFDPSGMTTEELEAATRGN